MENTNVNVNVIDLANAIMDQFRIKASKSKPYSSTIYSYESRLGIVDKDLDFEATTKMLKEALAILKREYELKTSQMGMYFTVKKYVTESYEEIKNKYIGETK